MAAAAGKSTYFSLFKLPDLQLLLYLENEFDFETCFSGCRLLSDCGGFRGVNETNGADFREAAISH